MPRILIVEDDPLVRRSVQLCLEYHAFRVILASDGEEGLELALRQRPDLVILDVNLPKLSGFEICRELRRLDFDSPILMLTSRHLVADRVTGLDAGADDYLPKPFELSEFLARIHALLRLFKRVRQGQDTLTFGDVTIDLEARSVTRAGKALELTKTEFALLELLGKRMGEVVSRETILDVVWGYARFPSTRTVDTHIWRLRKKLGDVADEPKWLQRVHGQGYRLVCTEDPSSALHAPGRA